MTRAITGDPAMLLFLDGISNRRDAINENYGRELMELFTLGADRGAYTETDVRELAKALSGWDADWVDGDGLDELPLGRARPLGPGDQDRVRQVRPLHAGRTPAASSSRTRCTRRSSSPSCGATSSRRRRPRTSRPSSSAPTSSSGHQIRPVRRGDPAARPSSTRARAWSSRPSCSPPGMLRALELADRPTSSWVWLMRRRRPAALLPARRRRAGTTSAGSTRTRSARAGTSSTRSLRGQTITGATWTYYPAETRRRRPSPARARSGGDPRLTAETVAVAARRSRDLPCPPRAATREPARPAPERAAPADRRLPRLPDLLRTDRCPPATARTSPAPRSCAQAAATAGRGLRAIEPGMPLPAGTGLSRRSFLARTSGLALAVFGGGALAPARAGRTGIAAAAAAGPEPRARLDLHVRRRSTRSRCSRRSATPATRRCAPTLALPQRPAGRVRARTPGCAGTRRSPPIRDLHARGQGHRDPGDRLRRPNQSHFTSRHYWEVGEINPLGRVGWLGRYLDRTAPPTTRSRASRSTTRSRRRWRRRGSGRRRRRRPRATTCGRATSGTTDARRRRTALRRARRDRDRRRRARARPAAPRAMSDRAAGPARRALRTTRPPGSRPVAYPASELVPAAGSPCWPRCSARACRCACVALDANGGYDTHENQAATLHDEPRPAVAPRWPRSRPTSRRAALADRVLVHVWSEFGRRAAGERLGHRPRRGRRVPADRARARRARWSASSPAWRRSTRSGNLRTPSTSAPSTRHGAVARGLRGRHRARRGRVHRPPAGAMRLLLVVAAIAIAYVSTPAEAATSAPARRARRRSRSAPRPPPSALREHAAAPR